MPFSLASLMGDLWAKDPTRPLQVGALEIGREKSGTSEPMNLREARMGNV